MFTHFFENFVIPMTIDYSGPARSKLAVIKPLSGSPRGEPPADPQLPEAAGAPIPAAQQWRNCAW